MSARPHSGPNGSLIAGLGTLVLLAAWFAAVRFLHVPSYILPAPEAVVRALWSGLAVNPASSLGYYLPLWSTFSNAAVGFLLATIVLISGIEAVVKAQTNDQINVTSAMFSCLNSRLQVSYER